MKKGTAAGHFVRVIGRDKKLHIASIVFSNVANNRFKDSLPAVINITVWFVLLGTLARIIYLDKRRGLAL